MPLPPDLGFAMSFKTTYFLFATLVVLLVIFGVALWKNDEAGKDVSGYVLQNVHDPAHPVKTEDVDQVVIERKSPKEETLTFVKDPETKNWQITTPRKLRADSFAVNDLIRQVFDARRDEKADKPANLKQWDLDPPNATVTFKKGDEKVATLNIGGTSPGSGSSQVVYVCPADSTKAAAVKKNQIDSILKSLVEFRDRGLLASNSGDIQELTVAEGKKETVSLKKDADSRWRFAKPESYGPAEYEGDTLAIDKTKQVGGLKNVLDDLANLKVEYKDEKDNDFVKDGATDGELVEYGLDPAKGDALRVEIERAESHKSGEAGKDDKKTAKVALLVGGVAKKDADNKPEKYYARLENEKNVVRIPAKGLESVRKLLDDPNALRDKTLVQLSSFAKPDAIVIKNDSGTLEFFREDSFGAKPWKLYRGGDKGEEVDAAVVDGLVNLLTQKGQVRTFVDDPTKKASLELDKPVAVVSVWVDGIVKEEKKDDKKDGDKKDEKKDDKKDEKKDGDKKDEKKEEKKPSKPKLKDPDKPTVRLLFGKKEGGLVAVERVLGGEKTTTIVKVPELLLDRAKEGPLAYFDKSLPQFNPGEFVAAQNVTKLVLQRGGNTIELTREAGKDDAPWKFAAPKEMAGRTADAGAVTGVLNAINRLQAQKLVAEKASAADLQKEYGLGTPSLKAVVTVTKDGKGTDFVYEFGKQLDNSVYGKQGQRDTIFTVDKAALAPLETTELQDKTVFTFDVAKVKELKLIGWQSLLGSQHTIDLEREDASGWKVKAPPGFMVDATKVRRFLDDLSKLKAESFVAHNVAKPAPQHELEVAKGALEVEITLEGEMEPLKLTVGKLDGDKGYFATTNKLPGDVLLLRKEIFESPKSKPAHFSP
jgi:hypothetical protein